MKSLRLLIAATVLPMLALLFLVGCGGSGNKPAPTLSSIAVTPASPSVGLGATVQFTATGTFSDSSTKDVSSQVTWTSGTTATATIAPSGLASTLAIGSSVITASVGSVSGMTTLTVTAPALASIKITPAAPSIPVGGTVNFTAVGLLTDGTTQPLAGPITWSSGTTATATILPNGIALGVAVGSSTITAAANGVSGTATLTVTAATARFAYVSHIAGQRIITYAVNSASGTFVPRGVVTTQHDPVQLLLEPSGRHAYILGSFSNGTTTGLIDTFSVDPVNGNLTFVPNSTVFLTAAAGAPSQGVIDPSGQFLYVANPGPGTVTAFAIDPSTGALQSKGSVPAGTATFAVITDRQSKFLYAINSPVDGSGNALQGDVFEFSIKGDGSLTPLATPSILAGTGPAFPAIDPQNKFLYVPNIGTSANNDDSVSVFSIDTSGAATNGKLTAISGSPFLTGANTGPVAAAVDPSSKFLYVANSANDTVSGFSITPTGALGAQTTGSPYATSPTGAALSAAPFPSPVGITIDPGGAFVAVPNNGTNDVALFKVNSSTGVLTSTLNTEAYVAPAFITISAGTAPVTVGPAAVFASNSIASDISAFPVAPSTGVLTLPTTSPVLGATGNALSVTDVLGQHFYTVGTAPNAQLAAFSVTQSGGQPTAGLSAFVNSPLSLGASTGGNVVVDPTERFVYAAGKGTGSIFGFSVDSANNKLDPITPALAPIAGLNSIAEDPQGLGFFALATNSITGLFPDRVNGNLTLNPPVTITPTGNWTAGAVDATGQFLLAIDTVTNNIQVFNTGLINASLSTAGAAVATGGSSPVNIAIDPFDHFVFVTDSAAKTVKVFPFHSLTGQIDPAVGTGASLTGAPGQLSVDESGTYLYVAVQGAIPASNNGSVAAFKIGSNGSLTPLTGAPFAADKGTAGVAVANSAQ